MTLTVVEDELAALLAGQHLRDPFPIWNRARETAPVIDLSSVFVVTRHTEVREMLMDAERFSAEWFRGSRVDTIRSGFSPEVQRMCREMAEYDADFMARMDGPRHERLRRIAGRFFTSRRVRELTEAIQAITDDLIDEVAEREAFDQKWLSADLALRVVSHIVGSPAVDREYLAELIRVRGRYVGTTHEQHVREAYPATKAFDAYVRDVVIAEHRRNPGSNDLVAALMDAENQDNITTQEFVVMVMTLFAGGVATTEILLTNGLAELMRHRDQWQLLCASPELAASAVDELLRYVAPTQWALRVTKHDSEWHGVKIPAEASVYGSLAAANRDPRVYASPDMLDIRRGDAQHLSLGAGPHFCLGQALVRLEGEILLKTLARRCPDLRPDIDLEALEWEKGGNAMFRSPWQLPMRPGRVALRPRDLGRPRLFKA